MKNFWHEINCAAALFWANARVHVIDWRRTLLHSFFMMLQNTVFFMVWVFFFNDLKQVGGWGLQEVSMLFGLIATAIGTGLFFFDGIRTLASMVQDGSLDSYLTRPSHALPAVFFSRTCAASLGDILTGPLYWLVFCDVTWRQYLALFALSMIGAVIFTASLAMICCLSLFLKNAGRLTDQLMDMLIISCSIPLHTQPLGIKILLFTLMPTAFVSYVPILLMKEPSALLLAALLGAMGFYAVLAFAIFNRGVARYRA